MSAVPGSQPYLVDLVEQTCTCPDYERSLKPCVHYEACMSWIAWQAGMSEEPREDVQPKRRIDKRKLCAFDVPQPGKSAQVQHLLHLLCEKLEDSTRPPGRPGRKPIPRREAAHAAVSKIYSLCSGRRA
ncbi:MAG TPA: SWIM zinc finger family protein, partial [Kofleriaceae bacterium]|nr:SWIM zinc finger family protein [Kofleriaceae bacterium]